MGATLMCLIVRGKWEPMSNCEGQMGATLMCNHEGQMGATLMCH